MQDKELVQHIEELIEIKGIEANPEPQNQDFDLIPIIQQVTIQSPPPPTEESTPSEAEELVPLNYDLVMDTYNLTYDKLQKEKGKKWYKHGRDIFQMTSHILHLLEKG